MKQIIGIVGLIGSGKDTISDRLTIEHDWVRLSFSSKLKDTVSQIFGWDREMLEGRTTESRHWREQEDSWWAEVLQIENLTPRWVLQYWGTEVCRRGFHQDIWIRSLERQIIDTEKNVIITDARFTNEIDIIHSLGGKVIRVKRGPDPQWFEHAVIVNTCDQSDYRWDDSNRFLKQSNIHESERAWVGAPVDYVVENDGTIENLNEKINKIVRSLE